MRQVGIPLSGKQESERLSLYNKGLTDSEIAHELGLRKNCVYLWRRSRQLPHNWVSEVRKRERDVLELYYLGLPEVQIAEKLGLAKSSVSYLLRSKELPSLYMESLKSEPRDLTEGQRAYLAGIIDGEGHISASRPIIGITNTSMALMEYIMEVIGHGSIYKRTRGHRIPVYQWETSTNTARWVLREIYPYLVVKKDQARKFLDDVGWDDVILLGG